MFAARSVKGGREFRPVSKKGEEKIKMIFNMSVTNAATSLPSQTTFWLIVEPTLAWWSTRAL
jgi:hypothetical protein